MGYCRSRAVSETADVCNRLIAKKGLVYIEVTGFQKQPPEVFFEKGVLRNFAKFTGKYLCQSLFFNYVAGLGLWTTASGLLKDSRLNLNSLQIIIYNAFFG